MKCGILVWTIIGLGAVCGIGDAQAQLRPEFKLDSGGGRIIALSRLSTASGCATASGTGRVVKRHPESGALKGITFKDDRFGESYINLPNLAEIADPGLRARVEDGFASLLVAGLDLRVTTAGCGAGGRIEKLVSVALRDARAATGPTSPAPTSASSAIASRWKVERLSPRQINLTTRSSDRRFTFWVGCMQSDGKLGFSASLEGPRGWRARLDGRPVSLDGAAVTWELGGVDGGYVVSDTVVDNTASLSVTARAALAKGQRLAVEGKMDRGRPHSATFDLAGSEADFKRFEEMCRAMPAA